MDPSWIEFQSENDLIDIVPNFTAPTLSLLQCDVGPFKAGQPLSVPFWLGSSLRKRQKCRIIQPNWMSVDTLEEVKEAEKQENLSNDKVILLEIHYFDRTSGHKKCKLPFKVEPLPLADVEDLKKNFCKKNPETGVQKQFKCLPCVCRIEASVALKQHLKG